MGDAFFGPDVSKFTATYDAAGALSIAIQFSAVVAPPIEISTGVAGGFSVDDLESVVCGGAGTPVLAIAISLSSVGPPSVGSATLSLPTGALPGAVDVDGSGTTVTASFNDGTLAGLAPVCAEQARVGGDVAPDGPPFAFLPFGGFAPLCADGIDNDDDGAVDLEDPGCRGALLGRDEIDPTPVAGSAHVQSLRRTRLCGFRLSAIAGPTIEPAALFPRDGTLRMTIRRLGGQGILRDRAEGPSASKWGVDYLARGSYRIEVRYLGDTFRRASIARAQKVRINGSRCFAPPSRAAYRRYGVRANRVSKALNRTAAEGGRIKLSAFPDGSWSAGARSLRRLAREFRAEASQWDAIS
ncbi:MAG: hypothetical protein QOH68_2342, partial [Nocardioidaceae bacterium]|nr:hypothetical protein [Nocardioidaceae bacterium]